MLPGTSQARIGRLGAALFKMERLRHLDLSCNALTSLEVRATSAGALAYLLTDIGETPEMIEKKVAPFSDGYECVWLMVFKKSSM